MLGDLRRGTTLRHATQSQNFPSTDLLITMVVPLLGTGTLQTIANKMGQGGYLYLVNATDSDWHLVHYHYYQMNEWSFPPEIPAGTFAQVYIEWDEGLFKFQKDDAGEAVYELSNTGGRHFEVQARADPMRLQVWYKNLKTVEMERCSVEVLGWVRDGEITFVLSEPEPGKYFTECC